MGIVTKRYHGVCRHRNGVAFCGSQKHEEDTKKKEIVNAAKKRGWRISNLFT
jgi:hypothetical protein